MSYQLQWLHPSQPITFVGRSGSCDKSLVGKSMAVSDIRKRGIQTCRTCWNKPETSFEKRKMWQNKNFIVIWSANPELFEGNQRSREPRDGTPIHPKALEDIDLWWERWHNVGRTQESTAQMVPPKACFHGIPIATRKYDYAMCFLLKDFCRRNVDIKRDSKRFEIRIM